jgi:hypothetical protein
MKVGDAPHPGGRRLWIETESPRPSDSRGLSCRVWRADSPTRQWVALVASFGGSWLDIDFPDDFVTHPPNLGSDLGNGRYIAQWVSADGHNITDARITFNIS